MADTDLLFKIIAQDEYKAQLEAAAGMVDKLSEAERNALKATTDKVEADQKSSSAIMEKIGAVQKGTESTGQLSQAEQTATGTTKEQTEAERGLSDQTKNLGQSNRDVIGSFTELNSAIELGQKAIQAAKQVWEFSKEGAAIQRIDDQFAQVAADFGIDSDKMIAAMEKAARGTVDDEELMQAAARSLTQGVITSQDQLVKFTEIARASAVRFGGDTAGALERILYATEVGAQRQLKATIGVVDFGKAYDDLAARLGKRKQDLTDEEQLQARVNAVLDKGADLVRKVGAAGDDTLTKMQRLETQLGEIADTFKSEAATGASGLLDVISDLGVQLDANATKQEKLQSYIRSLIAQGFDPESAAVKQIKELLDQTTLADEKLTQADDQLDRNTRDLARSQEEAAESAKQLASAQNMATTGAYGLSGALDETNRAAQRFADNRAYGQSLADNTTLAIQYTQAEEKRGDLEQKLSDLNTKIASQGSAHTVTVIGHTKAIQDQTAALAGQNSISADSLISQDKLAAAQSAAAETTRREGESTFQMADRLHKAQQAVQDLEKQHVSYNSTLATTGAASLNLQIKQEQLAVATEKLTNIKRGAHETEAEFALRVDQAKLKVAGLSHEMETHTAVVGGATKAQLEQKKALEEQIATFDKAAEHTRALDVFNAVTKSFQDGKISADEYRDRIGALNQISHLYTDTALETATKQELLVKSFTSADTSDWRKQLSDNAAALDGVVQKTDETADAVSKTMIAPRLNAKNILEDAEAAKEAVTRKMGETSEAASRIPIRPRADTHEAETQIDQLAKKQKDLEGLPPAMLKISADTKQADTALTHVADTFEGKKFEATAKVHAETQLVDAALAHLRDDFSGKHFEATATARADTKQIDTALAHVKDQFDGKKFEATATMRADVQQADAILSQLKDKFGGKIFEATVIAQADTQAVDTALSHIRDDFEGKKFEATATARADTQGVDQALAHVKEQFEGKKFEAAAIIRADVQQADAALSNIKDKFEGKKIETTATARADVTQASRDIEEWRSKSAAKSLVIKTDFDTKTAQDSITDLGDKQTKATQAIATESNRGMQAVEGQVTRTNSAMKTSGENALRTTQSVMSGVTDSIKQAVNLAYGGILDLSQQIQKIEGEHKIVFNIVVKGDDIPSIPSGGSAQSRQHGGPIPSEGFYWLHPNEYVLSAAMRSGQQPVPSQAIPQPERAANGSMTINNNNFYDAQAAKLWQEKQRLDSLQSVLEAM